MVGLDNACWGPSVGLDAKTEGGLVLSEHAVAAIS